ncbi:MAG: glutamate-5-semialdehyde dehydrogenase [bacterium]
MKNEVSGVESLASRAKEASRGLASVSTEDKNLALKAIAENLDNHREEIKKANQKDLKTGRDSGLSEALLDRLKLTEARIDGMIDGVRQVQQLEDPVGEIIEMKKRPNDLKIGRQRVPLGVIGIIYESRPNVTVDAAVLCLKSGNCTLLRGGSEAKHSNYLLIDLIQEAIRDHLPDNCVQILRNQDHALVDEMLALDDYIDVIIPRGGEGLIEMVSEKSKMPVIKHYKGVCHVYISNNADLEMARKISINAKTQRPAVCNAMETLVLDRQMPDEWVKKILADLAEENVELRCDSYLLDLLEDTPLEAVEASPEDWDEEYLDLILSVKSVEGSNEAIDHINRHASNHSDAIVTENYSEAEQFLNEIDSAAVYVNASTRFTDGYEFGLGAEIGISTERLHARGPMGLRELTIPKYVIYGQGQIRT